MIAAFETDHLCTLGSSGPCAGGPDEEAFAAARNDRISPCPLQNRGSIWKTSMCVPAVAAARSNVFGLPTSFAAPLPHHYL
jgi:hypothetical protein